MISAKTACSAIMLFPFLQFLDGHAEDFGEFGQQYGAGVMQAVFPSVDALAGAAYFTREGGLVPFFHEPREADTITQGLLLFHAVSFLPVLPIAQRDYQLNRALACSTVSLVA